VRSYFTDACVGEVTVTEVTLAETADASGLLENVLTVLAKACPFCSSWTRLLFGVDELKNASQFALIVAAADDEPLLEAELVAEAADVGLADGVVELELPLEQAVIVAANARPSAGARRIRRAM
jgi:hypothetical protein